MKEKWIGLASVAFIAITIIAYKSHRSKETESAQVSPRVLLVADLREADSADDACAEIIRDVRIAQARGVAVDELNPDSKSELLSRYHVLTVPTVLILDSNGNVVSRFEGEGQQTVAAVRSQLEKLH
jgi:hypothetical protein